MTSQPTFDNVVRISPTGPASVISPRTSVIDVARLASVSPSTVSRALKNPHRVARSTLETIRRVIDETGYASNPHAQALRYGRSRIVAAFASNLLSQQYVLAIQACSALLEAGGYQLVIGQTSYSYDRETSLIDTLQAMRPAAVMFTGVIELEQNRSTLAALNIPVLESWAFPRDPIDLLVGFSNTDAGRMAAAHLASRGYRGIAYIGRRSGRGMLRRDGFVAGLKEHGLELAHDVTVPVVTGPRDGRDILRRLMESAKNVDAVFCSNDLLCEGIIREASERGLRMPEDLALLGFGDEEFGEYTTPPLSTISFDAPALGKVAARLLLSRLEGQPDVPTTYSVPLRLFQRQTT